MHELSHSKLNNNKLYHNKDVNKIFASVGKKKVKILQKVKIKTCTCV